MNTPKYKLLVLTDLSEAGNIALENAVNLSKIINGSIDVFHVLRPSDITEYENQYSAMRSIDEERVSKKVKLKSLIREISKKTAVKINSKSVLGNLKEETMERIEATKPDIIVVGKRSPKLVNFLGDGFTKFILDKFEGSVLISGKKKALSAEEAMSLGMFNTTVEELSLELTKDLRKHTKTPIKQFHVRTETEQAREKMENVITYEFDKGSNTMTTIAKYVAKNNIGLLCINPHEKKSPKRFGNLQSNLKEAIQKINVPILIVNNKPSIQLQ